MNRRTALLFIATLGATACSRGMAVGSAAPGASYFVSVTNATSSSVDVFFNDGADHALGTVAAGKTERFIIAGTRQTAVAIIGRAGARTSGPYQVTLSAGSTPSVTLR